MTGIIYDAFPEVGEPPEFDPHNSSWFSFLWEAASKKAAPNEIGNMNDLPVTIHAAVASCHIRSDRRGPITVLSWTRQWVPSSELTLPPELKVDGMWRYKITTRAEWR